MLPVFLKKINHARVFHIIIGIIVELLGNRYIVPAMIIAPWGLWCRGLRFFMFVCLLFVCCLSRLELIQNGTRKSASSEGTMEKFGPKTVPFLDISCRISPVTSVTSLKMQWVSNY